jgi:hypothetical protein
MRRLRAFRPACAALEERVVLSAAAATAAAVAPAGDPSANEAALSAFGQAVKQGTAPTLTVDFGTPSASQPAGTVVMPAGAYSSNLGYGWISHFDPTQILDGAATGAAGDFEIDVPPATYDVTIAPATSSPSLSTGSQVTAFAADNPLGGPGAFFEDPGPGPVTLRTTVFRSGANDGLNIAMDGGFAIQSVQVTPVPVTGAIGLFTPTQPAPAAGPALHIYRAGGKLAISGTAQSSIQLPESGTMTWNQKLDQPESGSVNVPTADVQDNWNIGFPETTQYGDPNTQSRAPVTGVLEAIAGPTEVGTGGTFFLNTARGRLKLGVKGPANTALPYDELSSSMPLTYKIRGGTGAFRNASGSGTLDLDVTATDQSVEGTVTNGTFHPAVAEGTITLTFRPGA